MKSILYRLKKHSYTELIGVGVSMIIGIVIINKVNIYLGIITIILLLQIIHQINVYYDTNLKVKLVEKDIYINPDDVRNTSKELESIIELDNELNEFFNKYSSGKKGDYVEKRLNEKWKEERDYFVDKASCIFERMSNDELLITIASTDSITHVVNIFDYFKEISLNYDYLNSNHDNLIDYYWDILKLNEKYKELSINEYYYEKICEKVRFEDLKSNILLKMKNEDLLKLAKSSKEWSVKKYYFSFLKVEE